MEDNKLNSNKSIISKEFIDNLSILIDSRIEEVNEKLKASKNDLLEGYRQMLNDEESSSSGLKDLDLSGFLTDSLVDIETIDKLKILKLQLDNHLSGYDFFFKVNDKFKGDLNKIIKFKNNNIEFIQFKLKKGISECEWSNSQFKKNHKLENKQTM